MEPNGKLVVTITQELARYWDPHWVDDPVQDIVYLFKDIRWHRSDPTCLTIAWSEDREGPNRIHIPWHQILYYEVHTNSDEYVAEQEANRLW